MPTGQNIDGDAVGGLGFEADEVIAARLGCSPERIARVRCERGMRRGHGGAHHIDWRNVPGLGVETDTAIGNRLGVCRQAVLRARERLGIPPAPRRSTMISLPADVYHEARARYPKMSPQDALAQVVIDAIDTAPARRRRTG
jgi:hypothetical protein